MSYGEHDPSNPYAAPSAGTEAGGKRGFAIEDDVRKLISTTATLMIVAGVIQLISGAYSLIAGGVSAQNLVRVALFGVVPAFTAIAGFSLRGLGRPGDDLGSMLAGFRSLHVAFVVKGVVLLLIVGLVLLGVAAMFLGVGVGFLAMWD